MVAGGLQERSTAIIAALMAVTPGGQLGAYTVRELIGAGGDAPINVVQNWRTALR